MKILGIETSCDDTCISVIKDNKILSNLVSSQEKVHAQYGGVFPSLAKREHQTNIVPLLIKGLKQSKSIIKTKNVDNKKIEKVKKILERNPELFNNLKPFLENYEIKGIDRVAITIGPGLEPCLWVGVNLAKALSFYFNLPIVKINHIEGHIMASLITNKTNYPAIALIVSGGNTQLILIKEKGKYKIIGETRDDAAGECLDKTARILGLGYPGGPNIAKYASKFKKPKYNIKLPRPMINDNNLDFSFSGLKTAVLYETKKTKNVSEDYKIEMAYEIQNAVIDVLLKKTIKAFNKYKAKTIILGGGVSANKELRKRFKKEFKDNCLFPEFKYSMDNAVMIAFTGKYSKKEIKWNKLNVNSNLNINAQ
ncbi:MAG: tRNA (adenosine(37)-N6)-threonylcarbamoyltransferase complex transferase subunit TsaD [Candidatus Pacebacteria bacterium]|nr:tRNA (adenosine(37)-N6)-threonylcarbamoyltransferase complex transferase subunit TsaD [Candidatus Paceibacterota bacterium]